MKRLWSLSKRLKKAQAIEPCSFLFVVKEETTGRFKFYGHGSLLKTANTRFIASQPLLTTPNLALISRFKMYHVFLGQPVYIFLIFNS